MSRSSGHMRLLIMSAVFLSLCCSQMMGQRIVDVYLNSDEVISGSILKIGSDHLLLNQSSNMIRINRDEINFISGTKTIEYSTPQIFLSRINKKWTTEVQSGITVISPLALRADLHFWRKLSPGLYVGIGPTFQFYRFASMNATARFRYMLRKEKFIRPFVEGGGSVSFYESVTGMNFVGSIWGTQIPPSYRASFTRIKQIEFGPGIYMDTGLGVAFTSKMLFNATWFSLTQIPRQGFEIEADYSIYTLSLLGGFIF